MKRILPVALWRMRKKNGSVGRKNGDGGGQILMLIDHSPGHGSGGGRFGPFFINVHERLMDYRGNVRATSAGLLPCP